MAIRIAEASGLVNDRDVTSRNAQRRPSRPRGLLGAVLAVAALSLTAGPALAADPLDVAGEITDQAGALTGSTAEVQAALDRLADETPLQLFVVYVDTFDGLDGEEWATETALVSGLGVDDILMAVAVDDRRYGISVDDALPLTDAQLTDVRTEEIEPALRESDWAGAAVAAADGYREAYTAGTSSGGGGGLTWLLVGVLVVAGVIALVVVLRRRGRRGGAAPGGPAAGADALHGLPTDELNRRASSALVEIDDALTTSQQELGFAQAQFGLEATAGFSRTIDEARPAVARAFTLRQQLDDATPETEEQARILLIEIITTCEQVSDALDAEADAFDKLRDLQERAPQVLDETEQRAAEVERRLEPVRATLSTLAATYPAAALASVTANPDQAAALLTAARRAVADGRQDLEGQDRAGAVAQARIAEDAVAQASTLLDAVERAGGELVAAGQRLQQGLASIEADLADAARLVPGDPAVASAAGTARTRADEARAALDGGDPLTALSNLTSAEAALDAALAPAREAAEQDRRTRAMLGDLLGRVGSQVRAVNDFIETRRGAVGPEARTRLAEAIRLLTQATQTQTADPRGALAAAQQAEQLAQQAQAFAQRDVQTWESQQRGPGGVGGGMNAGSLVLGGILLDSALRGGRGGFSGGGFSGGGFSGGGSRPVSRSGSSSRSTSSGGRSAGSFGGAASRGRRGGGGRF